MEFERYETKNFGSDGALYRLTDYDGCKYTLSRYGKNEGFTDFVLTRITLDPGTGHSLHESGMVFRCGMPTVEDGVEHFEGDGHTVDISADKVIIDAADK